MKNDLHLSGPSGERVSFWAEADYCEWLDEVNEFLLAFLDFCWQFLICRHYYDSVSLEFSIADR